MKLIRDDSGEHDGYWWGDCLIPGDCVEHIRRLERKRAGEVGRLSPSAPRPNSGEVERARNRVVKTAMKSRIGLPAASVESLRTRGLHDTPLDTACARLELAIRAARSATKKSKGRRG